MKNRRIVGAAAGCAVVLAATLATPAATAQASSRDCTSKTLECPLPIPDMPAGFVFEKIDWVAGVMPGDNVQWPFLPVTSD